MVGFALKGRAAGGTDRARLRSAGIGVLVDPRNLVEATGSEVAALSRAAATYLLGIHDPHDEDVIEIVYCRHPAPPICFTTPVVLVHGYLHNWSGWLPLIERLTRQGFVRFLRFNYDVLGDRPEEIAGSLALRLREVYDVLDVDRIHLVGHSLGGAVARIYDRALGGEAHIVHAVTLGGVLNGTPWARLPLVPTSLRDLAPGSDLVRLMQGGDDDRSRWTCIAGSADVLVPPRYALLAGAHHHIEPDSGHVALLYDNDVLDLVVATLTAAQEQMAPPT